MATYLSSKLYTEFKNWYHTGLDNKSTNTVTPTFSMQLTDLIKFLLAYTITRKLS